MLLILRGDSILSRILLIFKGEISPISPNLVIDSSTILVRFSIVSSNLTIIGGDPIESSPST